MSGLVTANKRSKAMDTVRNTDVVMAKFLSGQRRKGYAAPKLFALKYFSTGAARHVMSMIVSDRARATRSLLKVLRM